MGLDRRRCQRRAGFRASPKQSSGGKGCHHGTEKQEDAHRSESWILRPGSAVDASAIMVLHLLNIGQRPQSMFEIIELLRKEETMSRACRRARLSRVFYVGLEEVA